MTSLFLILCSVRLINFEAWYIKQQATSGNFALTLKTEKQEILFKDNVII